MNCEVTEDKKEFLESMVYAVILNEPVEVFDGFFKSSTNKGYVIGDVFFAKPPKGYSVPLIFKNTLINRRDNSAEHTYLLEHVNIKEKVNSKIRLEPRYYNGHDKKIFSYFRIIGEIK
jgi:hypothetical protein